MRGLRCAVAVCVLLCLVVLAEGKLLCFRKLKRNTKCAGIVRKGTYLTAEDCCRGKGAGFATKKQRIGKNRFRCTPCTDLLSDTISGDDGNDVSGGSFVPSGGRRRSRAGRKLGRGRGGKKQRRGRERNTTPTTTTTTTTTTPATTTLSKNEIIPVTIVPPYYQAEVNGDPNTYTAYRVRPPSLDPDAEVIQWGPWSPCSVTCGAGWRSRFKVCDDCDKNDYENAQSQPCMLNFYCPVDGNWGPWFPWQPCSASCNSGTRLRQRKCNYPPPAYGGRNCPGDADENQVCNDHFCPVDGNWSQWSAYSECSVTCGQGFRRRDRECDDPPPQHGGRSCRGPRTSNQRCEMDRCPQDGGWSLWGAWAPCPVTCGEGFRTRVRACDSPKPMYGGRVCEGEAMDDQVCYGGRPCPVDGGWSEWTNYGFCRPHTCGKGFQVRTRTCTKPRPMNGGRQCEGNQYEQIECSSDEDCPRDGQWCEWGNWSTCSSTCKEETSLQVRQRSCACPAPHKGKLCDGEALQVKKCEVDTFCRSPKTTEETTTPLPNTSRCQPGESSGDGSSIHCDQDAEDQDLLKETVDEKAPEAE